MSQCCNNDDDLQGQLSNGQPISNSVSEACHFYRWDNYRVEGVRSQND